ncbi:hypothetical protein [Paucisalibacillus sp. EB02]|uniref:hypothetical protein n=1 Tax=Paucisalibacillus sp. EB02 TaxID=1347087 RepID=UPI0004B3F608|nr:hypothetical protein [Paucisalibacillus sp. EB02]
MSGNKSNEINGDYKKLEKDFILFKERTYDLLEEYKVILELLEKERIITNKLEKGIKSIQNKKNKIEKELAIVNRKYNALSKSKLGKITVRYWQYLAKKRIGGQR